MSDERTSDRMNEAERDAARREMIARCDDEIQALLRDARAAGVAMSRVVILVADERDPLGKKVIAACSEYGEPLADSTVYVVGANDAFVRDVLRVAAPSVLEHVETPATPGAARLFCFAFEGVRVVDVGITTIDA